MRMMSANDVVDANCDEWISPFGHVAVGPDSTAQPSALVRVIRGMRARGVVPAQIASAVRDSTTSASPQRYSCATAARIVGRSWASARSRTTSTWPLAMK